MKFILPLFLITATASAFSTARFGVRKPTLLRADASEAIKEALAASKEFGAASSQARVAWDIVEEIGSADNSAAFTGGVTDEECLSTENQADCGEYEEKLGALAALLLENKAKIEQTKNLAEEILSIEMVAPQSSPSPNAETSAMKVALGEAKEAAEKFGADSTESKLAWETVEEIASSGMSETLRPTLYDECLVEASKACEALDDLARVMYLEKNKTGRYGG